MNKEDNYLRYGRITVNLIELRVWFREQEIHLSLREMRVLLILLEEPYKTVARQELMERADLMSLGSVQVIICRLRGLLDHQYIVTHHERGYSFDRIPYEEWARIHEEERRELQAN